MFVPCCFCSGKRSQSPFFCPHLSATPPSPLFNFNSPSFNKAQKNPLLSPPHFPSKYNASSCIFSLKRPQNLLISSNFKAMLSHCTAPAMLAIFKQKKNPQLRHFEAFPGSPSSHVTRNDTPKSLLVRTPPKKCG